MKVYEVDSAARAISLAEKFSVRREYNWFRGQTHRWPLCPTLKRIPNDPRNEALLRLARFASWVKTVPECQYLDSDEAILAVAQHYGLPTHFLDFTTSPEVAAFFATFEPPSEARQGSILCINTADLNDVWNGTLCAAIDGLLPLRFIELHVPDLWRLQAQHGVFLDCPYANMEDQYPVDRIVFPHEDTGKGAMRKSAFYPDRKSRLEQVLERYFETERQRAALSWLISIGQAKNLVPDFADPTRTPSQVASRGEVPVHDSWTNAVLEPWLKAPDESWSRAAAAAQTGLILTTHPGEAARTVAAKLRRILAADPECRYRGLGFEVRLVGEGELEFLSRLLEVRLAMLWDGLRLLPYNDVELARAMGMVVRLTLEAGRTEDSQTPGSSRWRYAARRCFRQIVEIEFGAVGGGGSRAFVSSRTLLSAVRSDLADFVPDAELRSDVRRLLSAVRSPRRLFDFRALSKLFVLQAIPYQVCARTPPCIFTPAALFTLGLP